MVMRANGTDPQPLLENVALAGISCDWSPDGRTIVAGSADGRLMLVTPDGDATPLLQQDLDAWQSGGVWSPDGAKLAFSVVFEDGQGDVYTVAADGSAPTPTFASDLLEESAVWIP
jgi:Tol biopolymer transport system component